MTQEEEGLLIAYLVDAGELDPDGDVEAQFLDWYQVREGVVPGEVHYKAILGGARVRGGASRRDTGAASCDGFCDITAVIVTVSIHYEIEYTRVTT